VGAALELDCPVAEQEPTKPSEAARRRRRSAGGKWEAEGDLSFRLPNSGLLLPPPSAADLDNITLKALRKEVRERHVSVADFSAASNVTSRARPSGRVE
jgi:hypothetical protein